MKEEIGKFFHENLLDDNKVTVNDIRRMKMVFEKQNYDINILQEYIQDNFEYIINCSVDVSLVMDEIVKIGNIKEFIQDYFNDNFERFCSLDFKKFVFNNIQIFIEKNKSLLNEYLKANKKDYIKYLLIDKMFDIRIDGLETLNELVVMIVDEILDHEKKEYVDIKKLKSGVYSHVIQVGSKVVKLGAKRETYQVPNTSVLLQPLIRKDLSSLTSFNGTIEVMEKVETREHFSKEELYQVYKRARDEGVVILDLKSNNLGILLKDNVLNWSKSISEDMFNRGVNGNNKNVLKAGEIVLLDSDYIYTIDDYLKVAELKGDNEFEERYLLEKQQVVLNEESGLSDKKIDLSVEEKNFKTR